MSLSSKIRVAVLRGGPSSEYDISLKTGEQILSTLREMPDTYEPVDIFISKEGEWHLAGLVEKPHLALRYANVVWNALHGSYGEDGQVQKVLEGLKIPFTGSSAVASALSMDKDMAKRLYRQHSLLTPAHELITDDTVTEAQVMSIFRNCLAPVIIKPANGGSSIGIRLAHTFKELKDAIKHTLKDSKRIIVEEFIRGKEGTCGVVENFRGEKRYALLPIEIRTKNKSFFDFDSKYSGKTQEICPGNFKPDEQELISSMAKKAHEVLGLRHYSRSDFIITPKGKVYILETNSLPGFTAESLLPKSLHAVGFHPRDFVDHILKQVL